MGTNNEAVEQVINAVRDFAGSELTAGDAIAEVKSWETAGSGESVVVGAITDQDEARAFLEWLISPEAREMAKRMRESEQA